MEILKYAPHRSCGAYSRAALINHSAPYAALNQGRCLFGGGAYSSKCGVRTVPLLLPFFFFLSREEIPYNERRCQKGVPFSPSQHAKG